MFKLLTKPIGNPKVAKGMKQGVMTFPLHLAPADLSGFEVCPKRTAGCTASCLNTAGRGGLPSSGPTIQAARIRRTRWFFEDRDGFMAKLASEIDKATRYATKRGYQAAFRLNATSDIAWHRVTLHGRTLFDMFPDVQFYDYTKVAKRLTKETLPSNYHLTFSRSESNEAEMHEVLASGHNVAVVFRDKQTVAAFLSEAETNDVRATNGDETDLRFLDPRGGYFVALYAKGKAKIDHSGFVQDV